jgi:hypothetical protein
MAKSPLADARMSLSFSDLLGRLNVLDGRSSVLKRLGEFNLIAYLNMHVADRECALSLSAGVNSVR